MRHDITAYTKSGSKISGPYFSRYWSPHYAYLDAHHHNDYISGDGKDEEMTLERLQVALQRVEEDLSAERESLRQIEGLICGFQARAAAALSNLAAQREVLHAELQASEELRELKAKIEPIKHERLRMLREWRARGEKGWLTALSRSESFIKIRKEGASVGDRIDELTAPLLELEARIAELEPYVSNFERAVLEKQQRQMLEQWKPGALYILAPCQGNPEGEWALAPLQDMISSGVDEDEDEEKPKDEELVTVEKLHAYKRDIKVYEELRDFFKRCIEEDVVRMCFW